MKMPPSKHVMFFLSKLNCHLYIFLYEEWDCFSVWELFFSSAIVGSLAIGFVFLTSFFSGILSDRFLALLGFLSFSFSNPLLRRIGLRATSVLGGLIATIGLGLSSLVFKVIIIIITIRALPSSSSSSED